MKRWLIAMVALVSLASWLAIADAQDAKPPTVKEIMKKANFRDGSLCPLLGRALKVDEPNWDEVQREAHLFATLVSALGQNDPPRGDKASWQQLTKTYGAAAKELDDAAQRKDRASALAAHAKVANPATCNGCHKVHRN